MTENGKCKGLGEEGKEVKRRVSKGKRKDEQKHTYMHIYTPMCIHTCIRTHSGGLLFTVVKFYKSP